MLIPDLVVIYPVVNDFYIEYDDKIDVGGDMTEVDWPARVKGLLKAELKKKSHLYIGIHQEDERCSGAVETRPYIDIGVVVLK